MAKFKLVVTGTEFQLNGTKVNPKEVDFQLYDGLEQITVIENVIISDHGKSPLKKWLRKMGLSLIQVNYIANQSHMGFQKLHLFITFKYNKGLL